MPALIGRAGSDWTLQDVDVPTPAAGQALVRVRAAGVNRADLAMLDGGYLTTLDNPVDYPAGLELAGEVAAVGEGVDGLALGTRVMGTTLGAFATYAAVNHRHLLPVPDGVEWVVAGGLPVGLTTEHDALVTQAGFTSGANVLIVGATSGVGMIGVRMAKALGAGTVIATTTSAAKVPALRDAGADVDLDILSFRRMRVLGTTFSTRSDDERAEVAAALEADVLPAVADGRIRPVIDEVIPLHEAKRAADRLRANDVVGKLVIEMPADPTEEAR
jgi:NADPH:quinone reductase-like Zn-dependent oxidoreductase